MSSLKAPKLVNLHPDPLLKGCLVYYLPTGETRIGADPVRCRVALSGLNVASEVCAVENADNARGPHRRSRLSSSGCAERAIAGRGLGARERMRGAGGWSAAPRRRQVLSQPFLIIFICIRLYKADDNKYNNRTG